MMRLRQLDLTTFGHFTDRSLDFGPALPEGSDFHIVYGRNEAGKTTLMEGYLRLLYGFAPREPYAFKHPRANLRVGGQLEIDGTTHALVRLPKRSANLLDETGTTVPENILSGALRGVSQKEYQTLLCLDDETIEAGGEEITKSQGNIGRLLFSAAAGISDLSRVLQDVEKRNREIYLKGGSTSEFAVLKAAHAKVLLGIKEHDVSASAYRALRIARDAAQQAEVTLRDTRSEQTARKLRVERILQAHPLALELQDIRTQLDPIAHYPAALNIDGDDLMQKMSHRIAQVAKRDQAKQALEQLEAQRGTLEPDPEALQLSTALEGLGFARSQVEAGQADLPKRERQLDQETADLKAKLAAMGISAQGDLSRFMLPDPTLAVLETARAVLDAAHKDVATTRIEARDADRKLTDATRLEEDAGIGPVMDPRLDGIVSAAEADDIPDRYSVAQLEISTAQQNVSAGMRKLTRLDASFDAVPALAIDYIQAREIGDALAKARQDAQSAQQLKAAATARWEAAKTHVATAGLAPDIVSDADAATTRSKRDSLWAAHLLTLDHASADAFERAMTKDDAQTRLRAAQGNALAEMRQAQRVEVETRIATATADAAADAAQAAVDEISEQLRTQLRACGLPASLSSDDFASWIRSAGEARAAREALEVLKEKHLTVLTKGAQLKSVLVGLAEDQDASLKALMKWARDQIAARQAHAQHAHQAQTKQRDALAESQRRKTAQADAERNLEQARAAWQQALAAHIPDLDGDVETWNALGGLRALRVIDARMAGLQRQIIGIKSDTAEFEQALTTIGGARLDRTAPLLDQYAQLQAIVAKARATETKAQDLSERSTHAQHVQTQADADITVLDEQVALLAQSFDPSIDTSTLQSLLAATQITAQAITLRQQHSDVLHKLLSLLGVDTWEDAKTILSETPLETAEVDRADTEDSLERLGAELDMAIEQRTRTQLALDAVGTDSAISDLASRKRTIEEQMQDVLLRYIKGRFGHSLAEAAIRRYRDTHRSSMLTNTEKAFGDLTGGAYCKLTTQDDVLMAVQARDGVSKEAAAMSKGTRFQLYLALRAAAYEQLAHTGTILPFFCDDVFETFDEERTRAACQLMQRIGQTGQAIYLTHHEHVVGLAKEVCGADVTVHKL